MVSDYKFKNPKKIEFAAFKQMMFQDPTPSPRKLINTPVRFSDMLEKVPSPGFTSSSSIPVTSPTEAPDDEHSS
jgi:hypothetical protein